MGSSVSICGINNLFPVVCWILFKKMQGRHTWSSTKITWPQIYSELLPAKKNTYDFCIQYIHYTYWNWRWYSLAVLAVPWSCYRRAGGAWRHYWVSNSHYTGSVLATVPITSSFSFLYLPNNLKHALQMNAKFPTYPRFIIKPRPLHNHLLYTWIPTAN